ncbi:MAG: hypothetical protein ACPL7K_10040, partial [Armatimonadota bacterium]
ERNPAFSAIRHPLNQAADSPETRLSEQEFGSTSANARDAVILNSVQVRLQQRPDAQTSSADAIDAEQNRHVSTACVARGELMC